MPNCMPTSLTQGPGNNFLVGCADHDGEAFPPNEYVIDGSAGTILATITNVGGVDEVWYNSGDNRYYVAARDMPNGPVMGVIDAATNVWLQNVTTNSNSHSIAVDSSNNHAFVPLQAGGICTSQSSNGCIGVLRTAVSREGQQSLAEPEITQHAIEGSAVRARFNSAQDRRTPVV